MAVSFLQCTLLSPSVCRAYRTTMDPLRSSNPQTQRSQQPQKIQLLLQQAQQPPLQRSEQYEHHLPPGHQSDQPLGVQQPVFHRGKWNVRGSVPKDCSNDESGQIAQMRGGRYSVKLARRDARRGSGRLIRRLAMQRRRPAGVLREFDSLTKAADLLDSYWLSQSYGVILVT